MAIKWNIFCFIVYKLCPNEWSQTTTTASIKKYVNNLT